MRTIRDAALVCECCLFVLVNDDASGCDYHGCTTSDHPRGVGALKGYHVPNAETSVFRVSYICDSCGGVSGPFATWHHLDQLVPQGDDRS